MDRCGPSQRRAGIRLVSKKRDLLALGPTSLRDPNSLPAKVLTAIRRKLRGANFANNSRAD
jgi:hypothetical protein